jgi:hypothetical protein
MVFFLLQQELQKALSLVYSEPTSEPVRLQRHQIHFEGTLLRSIETSRRPVGGIALRLNWNQHFERDSQDETTHGIDNLEPFPSQTPNREIGEELPVGGGASRSQSSNESSNGSEPQFSFPDISLEDESGLPWKADIQDLK